MKRYVFFVLAILLFLASPGRGLAEETVTVTTTYPLAYSEYGNLHAENSLTMGSVSAGADTDLYGDMLVSGNMTVRNSLFAVAETGGPYGRSALRVNNSTNTVSVGADVVYANPPKLKVHTALWGSNLYAIGDFPIGGSQVYMQAHGYIENTTNKARFRAMTHNGTPLVFTDDVLYAPLYIDGKEVRLGEPDVLTEGSANEYLNLYNFTNGHTISLLIGADTAAPTGGPEQMLLQVGDPTDAYDITAAGWFIYSSREFKTDITPLSRREYGDMLEKASKMRVVRYLYKNEPDNAKKNLGIIAEESPREILSVDGKALNTSDGLAFLAAALKELKYRNDELKTRLEILEKRKAALSK